MAVSKRARPNPSRKKAKTKPLSAIAAQLAHIIEAGFAADGAQHQSDRKHTHGAQAPPVHLLGKAKILKITGVTFPTVWLWMRNGTFPRSRIVGGKSMWRSDEIDRWLAGLQVPLLKGDQPSNQTIKEAATAAPAKAAVSFSHLGAEARRISAGASALCINRNQKATRRYSRCADRQRYLLGTRLNGALSFADP